jgi:hypothetical protein
MILRRRGHPDSIHLNLLIFRLLPLSAFKREMVKWSILLPDGNKRSLLAMDRAEPNCDFSAPYERQHLYARALTRDFCYRRGVDSS